MTHMTHWKLILAYDGTPFRGWQIQPGLPTVQGLLSDAIHRTVGERVLPQGSGRTDTGVHALGQVASFSLTAPIPAANLHNALNRCLPPSIRILSADQVPPNFHARHSALQKTYEYRIFPLKPSPLEPPRTDPPHDFICPPILAPYVWPCPWPLDLAALNQAASQVLGTHDFTSFAAADPDLTARTSPSTQSPPAKTSSYHESSAALATASRHPNSAAPATASRYPEASVSGLSNHSTEGGFSPWGMPSSAAPTNIRTLTQSHWHAENDLLIYRVTATGFLHHMVRNLVGTFVQCAAHRLSPNDIPTILAARNRSTAGPTAPPTGLFLLQVEYADHAPPTTL